MLREPPFGNLICPRQPDVTEVDGVVHEANKRARGRWPTGYEWVHRQAHERTLGPDDIEVIPPELECLVRCKHLVDEKVVVIPLRGGWYLDKWVSRGIR